MERLTNIRQRTFALSASTITKIADRDDRRRRALMLVQNQHATDALDLRLCDNPWCLRFAAGKYLELDALAAVPAVTTATTGKIVANIRVGGTGSGARRIFAIGKPSADTSLSLAISAAGKLSASLTVSGTVKWTVATDSAVTTDEWITVALSHNGTKAELEVDGAFVAQTFSVTTDKTAWIASLGITAADKFARVGGIIVSTVETYDFVGDIKTLTVYSSNTSTDATRQAAYTFDAGTGTTVADATTNGITAAFGAAAAAPTWAFNCDALKVPAANGAATFDVSNVATAVWAYSTTASHPVHVTDGWLN